MGAAVTHIILDRESDLVKQFIRSLPVESEGVDLELDGRVICKVVPPFEDAETLALIERGAGVGPPGAGAKQRSARASH